MSTVDNAGSRQKQIGSLHKKPGIFHRHITGFGLQRDHSLPRAQQQSAGGCFRVFICNGFDPDRSRTDHIPARFIVGEFNFLYGSSTRGNSNPFLWFDCFHLKFKIRMVGLISHRLVSVI